MDRTWRGIAWAGAWTLAACQESQPDTGTGIWEDGVDTGSVGSTAVSINEILAFNNTGAADGDGEHDDWFELYAPTDDVSLDDWTLEDDEHKVGFTSGLVVPGGGFLLLWADECDTSGADHVRLRLDGHGDSLRLLDPEGGTVQYLEWRDQTPDVSFARVPDGSEDWQQDETPTPGTSNAGR